MPSMLAPENFLDEFQRGNYILIDTRSPAEFDHAHIPGAINIPLLNNEQRAIVGTTYRKEGHEAAVLTGFDLVGSSFGNFIREVKSNTTERKVFVYCWRGGMRSGIMSWVLGIGGFDVTLLKGGYKNYRRWVLNELSRERQYIVVGGKTGSGKTELLQALSRFTSVLDLENLANHRGSAFGYLGQKPQPSNEHFENMVAEKLSGMHDSKPIWIENESRNIGSVKIPDKVFEGIRDSRVVEINLSSEARIKRILEDYGCFPIQQLSEATSKLKKRLGEVRLREALEYLEHHEMNKWAELMLVYYDKAYEYGMALRKIDTVIKVEIDQCKSYDEAARLVLHSVQPHEAYAGN